MFLAYSELNPNLWTSEDVIMQEPTRYDNSDEQVSVLPKSKVAALDSQAIQGNQADELDVYRVKRQQAFWSSAEVHFGRPFHRGTQCHVKDCSQTSPLKQCGYEEHGQSHEKFKSSVSI